MVDAGVVHHAILETGNGATANRQCIGAGVNTVQGGDLGSDKSTPSSRPTSEVEADRILREALPRKEGKVIIENRLQLVESNPVVVELRPLLSKSLDRRLV